MVTRRQFAVRSLAMLAAPFAAPLAAPFVRPSYAAGGTVRIGLIQSMSGALAAYA